MSCSPAFLMPSAIGRGGPLRGMVASTHSSWSRLRQVGSFAVSEIKSRIGAASTHRHASELTTIRKPLKESSLSSTHNSRSGIDKISAIANNDGLKSEVSGFGWYQTRQCSASPGQDDPDAGW